MSQLCNINTNCVYTRVPGVPQIQLAKRWSGPSEQVVETSSPYRWRHYTHGNRQRNIMYLRNFWLIQNIISVMIPVLWLIKSMTMDYPFFLLANNLLVSVTDACRRLEDVGHTSVLSVWVGLDVAFRVWLLLVNIACKTTTQFFCLVHFSDSSYNTKNTSFMIFVKYTSTVTLLF